MKTGMLWFDDDPRSSLEEKVWRATKYYNSKYRRMPDVCLVHRSVFADKKRKSLQVGNVTVRPHHPILACTFWVGSDDFETKRVVI